MKFNKLSLRLGSAIVLEGLSKVVLFFVTILLAKTLSIGDFGRWNLWIVTIGYLQILIEFGTPMKGVRTVAEGVERKSLTSFTTLRFIGFVVSALLLCFLFLGFDFSQFEIATMFLWCCCFLLNADWFLRGHSQIQFVSKVYFLSNFILLAAVVYLYLSQTTSSANALMIGFSARVLVTLTLVTFINIKSFKAYDYGFQVQLKGFKENPYLKACLFLVAGAFFARIYYNSSMFVIEVFEGEDQLGYYSAGALFYTIFIAGRAVIIGAAYPILCKIQDRVKLNEIIRKASIAVAIVYLPLMIFALFKPALVISLISDSKFVTAEVIKVFRLFQFTCLILSVGIFTITRLHLYSMEHKFFKITVIIGLIGLLANLILIPWIGIVGGAMATLIAESGTILFAKFSTKY